LDGDVLTKRSPKNKVNNSGGSYDYYTNGNSILTSPERDSLTAVNEEKKFKYFSYSDSIVYQSYQLTRFCLPLSFAVC
jgi:hypothetical protein